MEKSEQKQSNLQKILKLNLQKQKEIKGVRGEMATGK